VVVTASDEVNAYRIFETLNDRGLKASQADILKITFSADQLSGYLRRKSCGALLPVSVELLGMRIAERLSLTLGICGLQRMAPRKSAS